MNHSISRLNRAIPLGPATLRLVFLILFTATSGCKHTSSAPEEKEEINVEATSDTAAVYEALCRYWERCRPDRLNFYSGSSVNYCIAFFECFYSPYSLLQFEDAAGCRDEILNAPCDSPLAEVSPESNPGFVMTTAVGRGMWYSNWKSILEIPGCDSSRASRQIEPATENEPCFVSDHLRPYDVCAPGYFCRAGTPLTNVNDRLCGVCEKNHIVGGDCDEGIDCETGSICSDGICVPRPTIGDQCIEDSECYESICAAGICSDLGELGDPCDNDSDCLNHTCSEDGQCIPPTILNRNDKCDDESYCDRDQALTCIDGRCSPMSDVHGPCEGVDDCRLGLVCHAGVCQKFVCPSQPGAFCSGLYAPCDVSKYECSHTDDVCVPRGQPGDVCGPFEVDCDFDSYCDRPDSVKEGVCTAEKPVGSTCEKDWECETSYCAKPLWNCELTDSFDVQCEPGCTDCGVCDVDPGIEACEDQTVADAGSGDTDTAG